jgi:hypothetical protein
VGRYRTSHTPRAWYKPAWLAEFAV